MNIPKLQIDPLFLTERLKVREVRPTDIDAYHDMQSDIEVMKYANGKALTLEENKADLKKLQSHYDKPEDNFWVWCAADRNSDELFGTVALILDDDQQWEIGYRLRRKHWGQGYATEAMEGLIEFVHGIDEIKSLKAVCDLRNPASQHVLNKIGFVNLGKRYNEDEDCEEYFYSMRVD